MELESTEKPKQNTSRHMVTFTVYKRNFAPSEQSTDLVVGDVVEWYHSLFTDREIDKVIINFALYLW